jgi:SAM-dependent methyltransferase
MTGPERRGPSQPPTAAGSPDRFGFEWDTYSELRAEHEEQFRRWSAHLSPADWAGKSFLDVGCGMGRNSYWPLRYGAARGVAVDIDVRSIAAARRTLREFPQAEVAPASAYDLPYRDEFDIVFSIGVVHHLADPPRALANMVRAAKPGGVVLIWVYGLENNEWIVRFVSPVRKRVLSRLPIRVLHLLSLPLGLGLWTAFRLGFGRSEYSTFFSRLSLRNAQSIVFDQLLPVIANYWPRATVRALLVDAGLDEVALQWVNQNSWSAIGRKPAGPESSDRRRG